MYIVIKLKIYKTNQRDNRNNDNNHNCYLIHSLLFFLLCRMITNSNLIFILSSRFFSSRYGHTTGLLRTYLANFTTFKLHVLPMQ